MVNTIKLLNTVSRANLELDTTETPYFVLGETDWKSVTGKHHTHKFFNQVGASVSSTSLEERDIEIQGWIASESEHLMASRKQVLNSFVNPRQPIELNYLDYSLTFLPTSSIRYTPSWTTNNEVVCRFSIIGLAPDPRWADKDETTVPAAATIPTFHFPLIIVPEPHDTPPTPPYPANGVVFGYRQPNLYITIRNNSSVPVGMRIVFRAYGTLTNPRLINVTTGEFFGLNIEMHGGDNATIVTELGQKRVTGTIDGVFQNLFPYRDIESSWLQLEVGDNVFTYSADDGIDNLDIYIHYYNRYLEVQQ
jgi:hypothetical protein